MHYRQFQMLLERLDQIIMSQGDINNAVTAIQGLLSDLSTQTGSIVADFNDWKNNQPSSVDTSGLDSAVSGIQSVQTALDGAVQNLNSMAGTGGTNAGGTPASGGDTGTTPTGGAAGTAPTPPTS